MIPIDLTKRSRQVIFVSLLFFLYLGMFLWLESLGFDPERDEVHFWPTSLRFSHSFWPTVDGLRNYGELNTPLPFLLFGWLEYFFGLGIFAGRLLNMTLSFIIVLFIGLPRGKVDLNSVLSVTGVLIFPYFLGASVLLYTDIIATFFALLGLVFHLQKRYSAACLMFILGIASRQYIIAFPLAVLAFETFHHRHTLRAVLPALLSPAIAVTTIFAWFLFFGGFAPAGEIAQQRLSTAELPRLFPDHSLYALTVVGAWYVIPEAILFRRLPELPHIRVIVGIAASLALAFIVFPPLQNIGWSGAKTMGFLDLSVRAVLPDTMRMILFYLLALTTCLRFWQPALNTFLVHTNAVIMLKSHIGWDKYALCLLALLWYLKARAVKGHDAGPE